MNSRSVKIVFFFFHAWIIKMRAKNNYIQVVHSKPASDVNKLQGKLHEGNKEWIMYSSAWMESDGAT